MKYSFLSDDSSITALCQITDSDLKIVYKPYKANDIVHQIDMFEHPCSSDADSAGVVITALVRDISYLSSLKNIVLETNAITRCIT